MAGHRWIFGIAAAIAAFGASAPAQAGEPASIFAHAQAEAARDAAQPAHHQRRRARRRAFFFEDFYLSDKEYYNRKLNRREYRYQRRRQGAPRGAPVHGSGGTFYPNGVWQPDNHR